MNRVLSFVALAGVLLNACSLVPSPEIRVEEDLRFCVGGDQELRLDLAMPSGDTGPFPGLVLIHGGGWHSGARSDYAGEVRRAARRGYVAITVDYRLAKDRGAPAAAEFQFPAQLEDVKCAVRWFRAHAGAFDVDPDFIGVMGVSSGAHLALMLATTSEETEFEGSGGHRGYSSGVQAAVAWAAPVDLARLYADTRMPWEARRRLGDLIGGDPMNRPDDYRRAGPIHWLSPQSAPILAMHGRLDPLVVSSQATLLEEKLTAVAARGSVEFFLLQMHGFVGLAKRAAVARSYEFLDQHLRPDGR